MCTHEDITERRQAQARIEHLARHDGLTDLPNRVLLREKLQEALLRMRPGEGLAVHCLDLDRFKEVNDALGHAVGDELLQDFAARLQHAVSETDTLARIGGDEYVIVQNPAFSPTDATDLAAQIIAAMNEPFLLGENFQVVLGTSIGIAMAPGDGTEADQLLKNANLALYRAKQEERGKYRFFEKEMDARMRARHELERNLRSALANGELDLAYQPLLNLKRNEISGFEALLRWRTADGSVIEPSEFVPLAEETGLIVPIGEWALRQALAEAAKWPRHIRVAVNLSAVQFNSRNLAQVVMSALAASGVEASRLELEITESLLLQDRETTLATLHQLRDLGVRIALDDFGTGFSSLNYLRSFPFDKIKIDRCFIAGLAEGNEELLAIVRAVARLGASLGIATTAEGVETQMQMEIARKEGFTEIQGFWLGRPKSAAAIAEAYDLYQRTRKPRRAARRTRSQPSRVDRSTRASSQRAAEDGAPKRDAHRPGPPRAQRDALLSSGRRPGLDRQSVVRAPFGPAAVIDRGVGLAEHGQSQRQDRRRDARPAGRDHGLRRDRSRRRRRSCAARRRLQRAVGIEQRLRGNVARAGNVAAAQAGTRLGLAPGETRSRARVDDLRRLLLDHLLDVVDVAHERGVHQRREMALGPPARGPSSSGRPSAFHFLRPPLSTATSSCPMARKVHQTRAAENRPCDVVDDDAHAVADAHLLHARGELHGGGQHVRQRRLLVGEVVDVEEQRAGNVLGEILRLGVAARGRQMPAAVEDEQVGGIEMLGEPVGLDDPLLGGVEHFSLSVPSIFLAARRGRTPYSPSRHRQNSQSRKVRADALPL